MSSSISKYLGISISLPSIVVFSVGCHFTIWSHSWFAVSIKPFQPSNISCFICHILFSIIVVVSSLFLPASASSAFAWVLSRLISASFFRSLIRTCRKDINACSCMFGSAADPAPVAPVAPIGAPVVDPAPPPPAPPLPYIRPGDNPAASICATWLA